MFTFKTGCSVKTRQTHNMQWLTKYTDNAADSLWAHFEFILGYLAIYNCSWQFQTKDSVIWSEVKERQRERWKSEQTRGL